MQRSIPGTGRRPPARSEPPLRPLVPCACAQDLQGEKAPALFVSRSGKTPGAPLRPGDLVQVWPPQQQPAAQHCTGPERAAASALVLVHTHNAARTQVASFDAAGWRATYRAASAELRPTSDTPLLSACLCSGAAQRHHWRQQPRVALHGHALAAGEGLEAARALGVPVSEHETLFSTPADLAELEALLVQHTYPDTPLYVRRGHGFFLLAGSVEAAAAAFEARLAPWLVAQQRRQGQQQQQQQDGGAAAAAERAGAAAGKGAADGRGSAAGT